MWRFESQPTFLKKTWNSIFPKWKNSYENFHFQKLKYLEFHKTFSEPVITIIRHSDFSFLTILLLITNLLQFFSTLRRLVMRFSPEIYVVKWVIDRSVSKLYTLATQDGDAILNPNGKTRVFQRDDLLKAPMNTPKTAFTLKKVNRLNPKILHPYWMLLFTKTVGETDGWQRVMTCGWTLIYCR